MRARTELTLESPNRLVVDPDPGCPNLESCSQRYALKDSGGQVVYPPRIVRVELVQKAHDFKLLIRLDRPLLRFRGLTVVAGPIRVLKDGVPVAVDIEAPIAALVAVDSCDLKRIRYVPIGAVSAGDLERLGAKPVVVVEDHETGELFKRKPLRVTPFVPCEFREPSAPEDTSTLTIHLDSRLPRGKTLDVTVQGVEPDVVGSGQAKTPASPDASTATYAVSGQYVLNRRGSDSWAVNGFAHPTLNEFSFPAITLSMALDVDVGAASLDLPDTVRLAFLGKYFLNDVGRILENNVLTLAPEFRTDRQFVNEDIGVTLGWAGFIPKLHQPLATRRVVRTFEGHRSEALELHWGWRLDPTAGLEAGGHVRSSSDEAEGRGYFRLLAAARAVVEYDHLTLDARYEARWLSTREVNMSGATVISVDDGFRGFLSAEFTAPAGPLSLVIRYIYGQQPPNFKSTNATTFGLKCFF